MLDVAQLALDEALVQTFTRPEALLKDKQTYGTRLRSGIAPLDHWLGEGIRPGQIIEWGLGEGEETRQTVLSFLRHNKGLTLWVYPHDKQVYPPAWAAKGVDLSRTFFLGCSEPVRKLKPLFYEDVFSFLIFDSPKKLSLAELAFLSGRLRQNRQILFVLRSYLLRSTNGNPSAARRINCRHSIMRKEYHFDYVRGGHQSRVVIPAKSFLPETV